MLGSEAEAQDALQEVFVILLEKGALFRGDSTVLTWVYRITTNVCLMRLRGGKRRSELLEERAPQLAERVMEPASPDALSMLRGLLRDIPEDEAKAGTLHWMDGMTQNEVATVLGCSRRKVGYLLERFLNRTRERLSIFSGTGEK